MTGHRTSAPSSERCLGNGTAGADTVPSRSALLASTSHWRTCSARCSATATEANAHSPLFLRRCGGPACHTGLGLSGTGSTCSMAQIPAPVPAGWRDPTCSRSPTFSPGSHVPTMSSKIRFSPWQLASFSGGSVRGRICPAGEHACAPRLWTHQPAQLSLNGACCAYA